MQIDQTTATSFSFRWDAPKNANGEIKNYNVFVQFSNFSYYNSIECNDEFKKEINELVMVDAYKNYTFIGALPYATYYIQVQVVNSGDYTSDFSNLITFETLPGLSKSYLLKLLKTL